MKRLFKSFLRRAGYELSRIGPSPTLREQNPDVTDEEWAIYSRVQPFTMLSLQRVLANLSAVDSRRYRRVRELGQWQGAKKAVDEYFQNTRTFLNRIDYTGRLAVKH